MSRPTLPSPEAFDRGIRTLSHDERTAFVGDLLVARGWDVDRDGHRLVATRDGRSKVVVVGSLAEQAPEVDEVVVVRSRARRLAAAFTTGRDPARERRPRAEPATLDTDRLYEQVRYGLDRDAASALLDRHFDAGLRPSHAHAVSRALSSRHQFDRTAVVLVAIAVLGVGLTVAGALTGGGVGTERPAAVGSPSDAASVPTRTPAVGPPPGAAAGELRDVDRLVRAHLRATGTRRNLSMSATFAGPRFLTGFDSFRSGYDAEDRVEIRVQVASDARYRIVRRTDFPGDLVADAESRLERFADGTVEYRRIDADGDTRYDRRPLTTVRRGSAELRGWARALLPRYLNTTRTRVTRADDGRRFRIVATGEVPGLDHDTRDYRAVATVAADGFVTDLDVRYVHPRTGMSVNVRVRFDRRSVSVDAPAWYDDARGQTRAVAAERDAFVRVGATSG